MFELWFFAASELHRNNVTSWINGILEALIEVKKYQR